MDRLWQAVEPLTVRDVHQALAADREIAYTTVMTVLDRLAKKGLVRQLRDGRAFRYQAEQGRDALVAGLMVEALGEATGSDDRQAALVRFIGQVTPEELSAVRAALDAVDALAEPPRRKRSRS